MAPTKLPASAVVTFFSECRTHSQALACSLFLVIYFWSTAVFCFAACALAFAFAGAGLAATVAGAGFAAGTGFGF